MVYTCEIYKIVNGYIFVCFRQMTKFIVLHSRPHLQDHVHVVLPLRDHEFHGARSCQPHYSNMPVKPLLNVQKRQDIPLRDNIDNNHA